MVFHCPSYFFSQRRLKYPWIIACDNERCIIGKKLFHGMMLCRADSADTPV